MLDVEQGVMVNPAVVVVEDGLITAINPPSLPADAKAIDLGDLTQLPGLIDAHVHLNGQLSRESQLRSVTLSDADRLLLGECGQI